MALEENYRHAVSLISLLHPAPHAQALIEITSMPSKKRAFKSYFFYATLAAEHAMEETVKGHSVFVGLNPRSQMSAFETDVPYVSTIGLDLQPEKNGFNGEDALTRMRDEMDRRFTLGGIFPTAWACSGGGLHAYFRLSEAAEPTTAKTVWQRLCRFTGSDPVHNPNRIFRVPGTYNWKSLPPRPCYLMAYQPDQLYTIEQINAALDKLGAGPATPPRPGIPVPEGEPEDLIDLLNRLPEAVRFAIQTGERNLLSEGQPSRSETDWLVVCALVRAGVSDAQIAQIYATQPIGLSKYYEAGAHYLSKTIESARRATAEPLDVTVRSRYSRKLPSGSAADKYRNRRRR